jgi:hypothetical protein
MADLQDRAIQILAISTSEVPLKLPQQSANIDILIDANRIAAKQYTVANGAACAFFVDDTGRIEHPIAGIPMIDEMLAIAEQMPSHAVG